MVEESRYEDGGALVINPSTLLARVIVRQIIEAGVTDVVISPDHEMRLFRWHFTKPVLKV